MPYTRVQPSDQQASKQSPDTSNKGPKEGDLQRPEEGETWYDSAGRALTVQKQSESDDTLVIFDVDVDADG